MTFKVSDKLETSSVHGTNQTTINNRSATGPFSSTRSQKRAREDQINTSSQVIFNNNATNDNSEPPKKKRKISAQNLEPIIEIPREDAFVLGMHAINKHFQEIIEKLGDKASEEIEILERNQNENVSVVPLKKTIEKELENFAELISKRAASQLYEIYQILEKSKSTKTAAGKSIIDFTKKIILSMPQDKQKEEATSSNEEIEDKYLDLAEKYLKNLPFGYSQDKVLKLAKSFQNAVSANDDESETSSVSDNTSDEVELAHKRLGCLILAAQNDINRTSQCLKSNSFESQLDQLSDFVAEILEEAANNIENHTNEHKRTMIQSSDEASFQQYSKELAKIILTDCGSINFGIIRDAVDILCPDHIKTTVAFQNQSFVLDEIENNPLIWEVLAKTEPPASNNIPSAAAIRACFNLNHDEEITKINAQLFLLSSLLGHMRQSKTGTCFTTAFLIKGMYTHTLQFAHDLSELTKMGYISRQVNREVRQYPMQERISKEFLDIEITVNSHNGKILSTKRYELPEADAHSWDLPANDAFLYQAPGIIAVCQAMRLDDVKNAVLIVIRDLPEKFTVDNLIKELANYAYNQQEIKAHALRSQQKLSLDEFISKGLYAFGVQTNHPLHRGYEQAVTTFSYFGTQYEWPAWIFFDIEKTLEKASKGFEASFQHKYRELLKELFLPLISRMRYKYNPNFDKSKILFQDGNYGIRENHWYGFQLHDTGLPDDFKYSTTLYKQYTNHTSRMTLERFQNYSKPHLWKTIETEEKFRDFLVDVVDQTATYMKKLAKSPTERKELEAVSQKMQEDICKPSFTKKLIWYIFGPKSQQKNKFRKDEHNMQTTPWQYAWGGDPTEVMKTFFGLDKDPTNMGEFNGTPKEVLAKCINYIKKQPQKLKEEYDNPQSQIIVCSPVHAFLMRPQEPTFKEAWSSDVSTNEFISKNVEAPGVAIANSRQTNIARRELLDFVTNNQWVTRYIEKEDWVRQQLTDTSKALFDSKLAQVKNLKDKSVEELQEMIQDIVIFSRAEDPNIGKRNSHWEQRFKRVFNNCVKNLVPNLADRKKKITPEISQRLIEFARNREDSVRLHPTATDRFLELMANEPTNLSIKDFREKVFKAAYKARCEYLCGNDPEWIEKFCDNLDNKIFKLLPHNTQEKLVASGIVTHDTNWKEFIHDIYFMFVVNPGTGKIELVRYNPDEKTIRFMDQADWFPRKQEGHGYWDFPGNYRVWQGAPLFNIKNFMD